MERITKESEVTPKQKTDAPDHPGVTERDGNKTKEMKRMETFLEKNI